MAGPEWKFGVLGALTIEHNGDAVEFRGHKPRELLALLLVNRGRPLSLERLIQALWGEAAPATAQSAAHVHLSKLRGLLGDLLERRPAGYVLRAGGYELDADAFEQLLRRADEDPAHARTYLTEALGLWRGSPLSGIEAEDALADWRRSLEEQRLGAIMSRIELDLGAGAGAELVVELQQLVAAHPYEERLWGQLMLALYRAERQADALDAFERARRLLTGELGLEPGTQLQRLQQQILHQDPGLLPTRSRPFAPPATAPVAPGSAAPGSAPSAPAEPAPDPPTGPLSAPGWAGVHQRRPRPPGRRVALPQPSTRLIGRDAALLELDAVAADPFCRLLTLTGPGGVGKTRLAIAHAAGRAEQFPDGVVFVGLAGLTDASQVRAEIAADISRRDQASEPNELTLIPYLTSRQLLLLLDNFEHVLGAADLVAELLESAPELNVLVTSRVPLRLRGERRFDVEPLITVARDSSASAPAVEMFLEGARTRDRHYGPTPAELITVTEICTALDGLPLAIELAAARSSSLGTAEIAAALEEPLTIGRGELRDLPERHQTVEAAIGWSYDLLSPAAQATFRAASVFVGPFTPEGLGAVAGRPITEALQELRDASLVQRSNVPGRFRLLDLVRAFGRARLNDAGEADLADAAHRRYLVERYADVAAQEFPGAPHEVALEMGADHADIRVAIASAVSAGDRDRAVTLAKALHSVWWVGQLEESGATVDSILGAFSLSPDDELRLLRIADDCNGYRASNDAWSRRRATRAAELGNLRNQVGALARLTVHAMNRGDPAAAIAVRAELTQVLDDNPELNPRSRGVALTALADCAYLQGDWAVAAALSTEAVDLAVALGDALPRQSVTARRQLQLLATSADQGWITAAAVLAVVDGALAVQLPDLGLNSLLAAARYAAGSDPDLATLWLANAERTLIEIGGVVGHDWQDETLPMLSVEDMAVLLNSVPTRPLFELLAEARDWLSARDPDERVPRAVPARIPGAVPARVSS